MSDVRWAHLAVAGTEARLACAGPAETDQAVVFVHGNPGSADDWTSLLGAVAPLSRGVAIDLPDFGETVAPPGFSATTRLSLAPIGQDLADSRRRGALSGARDPPLVSLLDQPQRAPRAATRVP